MLVPINWSEGNRHQTAILCITFASCTAFGTLPFQHVLTFICFLLALERKERQKFNEHEKMINVNKLFQECMNPVSK